MALEIDGKSYPTDAEGYLENNKEWSADIAKAMAVADDLDLTQDHWDVIYFMREYYLEYKISPSIRILVKSMGKKHGAEKGNSQYLYKLFPYGPAKQAAKYAGLPKPSGCV